MAERLQPPLATDSTGAGIAIPEIEGVFGPKNSVLLKELNWASSKPSTCLYWYLHVAQLFLTIQVGQELPHLS
jgi:hypothetical protein